MWTPADFCCGFGGATAVDLRKELKKTDLASFCTVYQKTGTNDLCSDTADIVVSDICALVAYLHTHGSQRVILGQVLFRMRR